MRRRRRCRCKTAAAGPNLTPASHPSLTSHPTPHSDPDPNPNTNSDPDSDPSFDSDPSPASHQVQLEQLQRSSSSVGVEAALQARGLKEPPYPLSLPLPCARSPPLKATAPATTSHPHHLGPSPRQARRRLTPLLFPILHLPSDRRARR